jgi:hypothetical protein
VTVFYGAPVGLGLTMATFVATALFILLDVAPAESAEGQATDPLFYLVLLAVSTLVAVLIEELFFGGVVFGVGYHRPRSLFVPLIGHVLFNGVQITLEAAEVAA